MRETAEVAAWWSAVWFLANWAGNVALAWTSVASVTILGSTSGMPASLAWEKLMSRVLHPCARSDLWGRKCDADQGFRCRS